MKDQDKGSALIKMLLTASANSLEALRKRVSQVKLSEASIAVAAGVECIDFEFDGKPYRAKMVGRVKDVVIGWNDECDRSVALSLMLDGHAEELSEGVAQ